MRDCQVPNRILLVLVMLLLVNGCTIRHELDLSNLGTVELVYFRNGAKVPNSTLLEGSEQHRLFIAWLERNRSGWQPLLATVVADGFLAQGDDFSLYFGKHWIVLTYLNRAGERNQLFKKAAGQSPGFLPEY